MIDGESRVLILGSVPSVKSVENNFYYMHPKNRFWKVLSCLYGVDLYGASVEERIDFLHKNHIALYDSVEECDIEASKDSAISNVTPADVPSLIAKSKISHIYCNGKASFRYLCRHIPSMQTWRFFCRLQALLTHNILLKNLFLSGGRFCRTVLDFYRFFDLTKHRD